MIHIFITIDIDKLTCNKYCLPQNIAIVVSGYHVIEVMVEVKMP